MNDTTTIEISRELRKALREQFPAMTAGDTIARLLLYYNTEQQRKQNNIHRSSVIRTY